MVSALGLRGPREFGKAIPRVQHQLTHPPAAVFTARFSPVSLISQRVLMCELCPYASEL